MSRSIAWSWRHAITQSELQPLTRLVLFTLSIHMSEAGENCYPSQDLLCLETGLTPPTLRKHLKLAEKAGWIVIEQAESRTKGRNRSDHYHPIFPDTFRLKGREDVREMTLENRAVRKGEAQQSDRKEFSPETQKAGEKWQQKRGKNDTQSGGKELSPISPRNIPKNNPLGGREREALDLIRQALPNLTRLLGPKKVILQTDTRRFLRACGKLPDETPQRILDAVTLYAKSEARDWKGPDANKRKRLAVILDDGLFETFLIPEARNVDTDFAAKLAAADRALEERNAA
jgi:hypothetical protein